MKKDTFVVRNGYDGEKCFVHARSCFDGSIVLMTAQYLFVRGSDLFDGIYSSVKHRRNDSSVLYIPKDILTLCISKQEELKQLPPAVSQDRGFSYPSLITGFLL